MKLSQCSALVAIADHGGFTKAAGALGISQSAISHAIAGLENELGCTLMERDRLGVRFTDSGRDILEHARHMVAHAEQIQYIVDSERGLATEAIRFATSESFAVRLLPTLVDRFRSRFPRQDIELRTGSDTQIAQWLRCQAVDVGVVTLPKDDLDTVPLGCDEMRLLLPGDHRFACASEVAPRELAGETLLMPRGGMESAVMMMLRTVGFTPSTALRIEKLDALLEMVAQGRGVAILPALALERELPGVVPVGLTSMPARVVALGVRSILDCGSAVAAFIAVARGLVGSVMEPGCPILGRTG